MTLPFAYVSALVVGLAAGAEADLIACLAGRCFGMKHYGRIHGFLHLPFGIASAISPGVHGGSRDATGVYDAMLHVATVMFVLGAVLQFLGRYPDLSRPVGATDRM